MTRNKELNDFRKKVRQTLADYMRSEGCSCCRDNEAHEIHAETLGKLLKVPKHSDGSGRNFSKFQTKSPS